MMEVKLIETRTRFLWPCVRSHKGESCAIKREGRAASMEEQEKEGDAGTHKRKTSSSKVSKQNGHGATESIVRWKKSQFRRNDAGARGYCL